MKLFFINLLVCLCITINSFSMDYSKRSNSLPSLQYLALLTAQSNAETVEQHASNASETPEQSNQEEQSCDKTPLKKSLSCIQLLRKHKKITSSRELLEHLTNEPRPDFIPKGVPKAEEETKK